MLPSPGSALTARFAGPYVVDHRLSETDYVIQTPEHRRKKRLCHVNMLKLYHSREAAPEEQVKKKKASTSEILTPSLVCVPSSCDDDMTLPSVGQQCGRLSNSEFLSKMDSHLCHLSAEQRDDVVILRNSYLSLFGDVPLCTNVLKHDIDVSGAKPIKQHAYRCPVNKREQMKIEVSYLPENGLAEPSKRSWSSPCLLAPKADGTPRFSTDFKEVNAVTVPDSFPLPQMEDCIDSIGSAVFITKLDLLKGYWQVPLTPRAAEISEFVTPDHFAQFTVMAFGMRNAPATFERLMILILGEVKNCNVYLDDVVVYSGVWEDHLDSLHTVFQRLAAAPLTLNVAKCEFGKATVTYLGKRVGLGKGRPVSAKVKARRELRRFLGIASYYRCFCRNVSLAVAPLTRLCSPATPFVRDEDCAHAF